MSLPLDWWLKRETHTRIGIPFVIMFNHWGFPGSVLHFIKRNVNVSSQENLMVSCRSLIDIKTFNTTWNRTIEWNISMTRFR